MDELETPYEEENKVHYIDCMVCNKAIRGETLYKIHLTTLGHLKKEDTLVAQGLAVREHVVPDFEDLVHYLKYLKIDEPVIGLDFLEEIPRISSDAQPGPRYFCRLCDVPANLPNVVHHVIGRKHRVKYLQTKRPELLNNTTVVGQTAKIIRAKAEIAVRKDGPGNPKPLKKNRNVGRANITVLLKQRQNIGQSIPPGLAQQQETLHQETWNYQDDDPLSGRCPLDYPNNPSFQPEDSYARGKVEQQKYEQEDSLNSDYRDSDKYTPDYWESDFPQEYQDEYVEDEPEGVDRQDFRKEMPRRPPQHADRFAEKGPLCRRSYPESDPLKEFYSEEVRRGQVRSDEYQASQRVFTKESQPHWSNDREARRWEDVNRAGRQGSSESEPRRPAIPSLFENDPLHDKTHLLKIITDYRHKVREPYAQEDNRGPSRTGPSISMRPPEVTPAMSDIPEPFRRFLEGAVDNDYQRKRKRKSRFSDATEEEVQRAKQMYGDDRGPPSQRFNSHYRPNAEIRGPPRPNPYELQQSSHRNESYLRGDSKPLADSGGVFDMLKNIEIENMEEADFLKSKLCSVLKEFQSKKLVKYNQGTSVSSNDYSNLKPDPQEAPRHQYERTFRDEPEGRRTQDFYTQDPCKDRGWEQRQQRPEAWMQDYNHTVLSEPRNPSRSRYEESFRLPEMDRPGNAPRPDEPARYPERLRESMRPRDYQSAADGYFDPRSSAPPFHKEQGYRMNQGVRHSSSLDKITSTLLELVARK
ncbi:uncharacterized protein LOC142989812 isoform X2 [Genypterus blacodes]|uniref:uncharacterized protein LOC142989812 isoform X2 n=1 Tax=Genypterus blacodes TaxID=154954 RepID=UPI003F773F52